MPRLQRGNGPGVRGELVVQPGDRSELRVVPSLPRQRRARHAVDRHAELRRKHVERRASEGYLRVYQDVQESRAGTERHSDAHPDRRRGVETVQTLEVPGRLATAALSTRADSSQ